MESPVGVARAPLDPDFLRRLERLDLAISRIERGDPGGRRLSSRQGAGGEFLEHRAYAPGDDRRYIDWNVYGRLDQLHVKEFTAEERLHLVLLVDLSPSMDFGRHNKLARARELAAALGFIALSRGDRVSLVGVGSGEPQAASYHGKPRIAEFLRASLELAREGVSGVPRPARTADPLSGAGRFLGSLGRRPIAVLFSDLFDLAADPRLARLVRARSERAALIHLIDPSEEDPAALGKVCLVDVESGAGSVVTIDREFLVSYRARWKLHLDGMERAARSARVAYVRVSTATPYEESAIHAFRRAGLLV